MGYGVTFPTKEFPRLATELNKRYPEPTPAEAFITKIAGHEIYFSDPDNIPVQLIQIDHNASGNFDPKTGEKL